MRDLASFRHHQVFLNYPFDADFLSVAAALNFAVVAAGQLPVCALDLTAPDRPRLDMLIEAISCCHYSIHDLSRAKGEGTENFARMNMPIEMGLALYPALASQRAGHRCAFFVSTPHDYKRFASDLAGLDPQCHSARAGALSAMAARLGPGDQELLRQVLVASLAIHDESSRASALSAVAKQLGPVKPLL
jgi:hypothetical protein